MFGILGFVIDFIIILVIAIGLLITLLCGVLGMAPNFMKWAIKLVTNPLFWILTIGFIMLS